MEEKQNDPLSRDHGLIFEKVLYDGKLSVVELWRCPTSDQKYAVKTGDREFVEHEADLLQILHRYRPNRIIPFEGILDAYPASDTKCRLITHFCRNGDLAQLAHRYWYHPTNPQRIPESRIWKIVMATLSGLNYIHTSKMTTLTSPMERDWWPIVHNDIKPQNIFIDANEQVKLADFGLSVLLPPDMSHHQFPGGTVEYFPPEFPFRSQASDIWSLGVVLHWLCTGEGVIKRTASVFSDSTSSNIDVELGSDQSNHSGLHNAESRTLAAGSQGANPAANADDEAAARIENAPNDWRPINIHDITALPADRRSNWTNGIANWDKLGTYSPTMKRFMVQMLRRDPRARPTAEELQDDMTYCAQKIEQISNERGQTWDEAVATVSLIGAQDPATMEAAKTLLIFSRFR
jgi:serine/threonine protein kinase